ncbi:MAG: pyridoxamine 5'-phosphate oxidase family protein [Pseudomonadales bacterium]|nr:pyridoxamine 5'-phosphate oxidase family protein [Pseudomonadales bacterium]
MEYEEISTSSQLRELYDMPIELVVKKQKDELDEFTQQYLSLSPFAVISTVGSNGLLDCSPRGETPGFIKPIDKKTIAIPDRPGNNRLDSLSNIIENPSVGILLLIPGFKECLRVNGDAKIVSNIEILEKFEHNGKRPKSAIIVTIKEIYFHCAKAITRSKLWDIESQIDRQVMPTLGRMLMQQIDSSKTDDEIREVEEFIEKRVKTTLY